MRHCVFTITLLLILACKSKNQQQNTGVQDQLPADSLMRVPEEDDDRFRRIDSIGEIKSLIFKDFQQHQGDSAYNHFDMPIGREENCYQSAIRIGDLFHPDLKSAVLGWSVTDSTMDMEVFYWKNGHWQTALIARNIPAEKSGSTALRSDFLSFFDYNHDGWKDLVVMIRMWDGIGTGYQSRLWLSGPQGFTPVRNFEKIDSPEPDSTDNFIYSYLSGGCADMAMHFSVWKLQGNAVRLVKEIEVDCCVGIGSDCAVMVNNGKPIPIPGNRVHEYVPKHFRAQLKEKMTR